MRRVIMISIIVLIILGFIILILPFRAYEPKVNDRFKITNYTKHNIRAISTDLNMIVPELISYLNDTNKITFRNKIEPMFYANSIGILYTLGDWGDTYNDSLKFDYFFFVDCDSLDKYWRKKIIDYKIVKNSILDTLIINKNRGR
jgi:hypothetical protein